MPKKPKVKCLYCGEYFSRELEEFVQVNKVRYAHKLCYDRHNAEMSQEERDYNTLRDYIKKLFGIETLSERIYRQIVNYHDNYEYTYSGMYKSLVWFYQIKKNPIDKANGSIGIIPYIYDNARNYYTAMFMAQQQNQAKPIEQYNPEIVEIHIPPPVRKPIHKTKFTFLDQNEEEGEDNGV